VRTRWITVLSFATLAVVFVADVKTPEALVLAILLNVPIVLSAFVGSRSLTTWLVIAALLANMVAGYLNGVQQGHWDVTSVWNRAMAALSIVMVGWLGTTLQERARRVGFLAERELRARREGQLAVAIDRVRASLSHDLVLRAIVREALRLFDGQSASWIAADRNDGVLVVNEGEVEVRLDESIASPEVASLARRAYDDDDILLLEPRDPVGGLVLDRIGAKAALIIPVAERGTALGIVMVSRSHSYGAGDDGTRTLARAFGRSSSAALAQARLFAQLAQRNEELAERSSVIRDLVYALSHDLRTPLAALGLTFRQAKDGLYGAMPEPYGQIIDRSIIATDELQRLADTLLLVARFESGERRAQREPVDVDVVVREVAGELQPIASARAVRLAFAADSQVRVEGDRSDLRRAVTNLVANALEHTPPGGHVDVVTHRVDGVVNIAVSDDGPGVGPDARATLFQRFAGSEGRRGAGSGLGLYIVRRVAEETGGTASYEPREPSGSVFTITAPVLR
jgi:signal transduction histidine kinase